MQFTSLPPDDLRPAEGNPRTHSAEQIAQIAASIREFGFTNPLLIDADHGIIAGHGRLAAAQQLGMEMVPCVILDQLSATQRRALLIADNQIALNAGWDEDLLAAELGELRAEGFDLALMGFDELELTRLLDGAGVDGLTDPDDVPDTPAPLDTVTERGDLWRLGQHRLVCGDSTEDATYAQLLAGEQADLLLTDPPYNVDYEGRTSELLRIANDAMDSDSYRLFLLDALGAAQGVLVPGGAFYLWHADTHGGLVRAACEEVELPVRQCLIWAKNSLVLGRQDYHWKHEPCLYGWKPGAAHRWLGDRTQTTVIACDRPARSAEHPTMKPIDLLVPLVQNSCPVGGIVLDPFAGSGSTVIACQKTGRVARVVELDPRYCDVIVRRWEAFTGKTAVRTAAPAEAGKKG